MESKIKIKKVELVGKYSAMLSLIELALGSTLHSLRIPFSGNFLSLNQGFLLCRASIESRESQLGSVAYGISNVSAVLKSLAPAGKKLGPMLSLSMQGLLFSAGERLLGANLGGWMLGMALLSLWTFLQPIVTYYVFFGSELVRALGYFAEKTLPNYQLDWQILIWAFLLLICLKVLFAVFLAWLAWKSRGAPLFQDRLLRMAHERGLRPTMDGSADRRSALTLAFRDLFQPLFLLSLAITAFFLVFSEDKAAHKIWILMRPIALAYVFFYFSRTLTLDRWLAGLRGTSFEGFARACQTAIAEVRRLPSGKLARRNPSQEV